MREHEYALSGLDYRLPSGAIVRVIGVRLDVAELVVGCRYVDGINAGLVLFSISWFRGHAVSVVARAR